MIKIVIGANYGDEGKGKASAFFASHFCSDLFTKKGLIEPSVAVVRFNGGAQAGHTAKVGTFRHVFSHFSVGAGIGVPTILTRDFVCTPNLFLQEREEIQSKSDGYSPKVFVDPECIVSTPFDMIINVLAEQSRGHGRHGSVGIGFGEAIERSQVQRPEFEIKAKDLCFVPLLQAKLSAIFNEYLPMRLQDLGIPLVKLSNIRKLFHTFELECQEFIKHVELKRDYDAINDFDHLVFEGAQGLLLDQNGKDFPHVTRSNTGVENAIKVLIEAGRAPSADQDNISLEEFEQIEVVYMTRPYLTRHGAGPLKHEGKWDPKWFNIVDETNVFNQFQENLRFAPLNLRSLYSRAVNDFLQIRKFCGNDGQDLARFSFGVICLDQIANQEQMIPIVNDHGDITFTSIADFANNLGNCFGESWGAFQVLHFGQHSTKLLTY